MKLSVKSDYAARAVLVLARHFHENVAIRVEDLAAEEGIPANYLVQILIELKSQNIVKSQRGKEGGYLLARTPGEITLGDILRSVVLMLVVVLGHYRPPAGVPVSVIKPTVSILAPWMASIIFMMDP